MCLVLPKIKRLELPNRWNVAWWLRKIEYLLKFGIMDSRGHINFSYQYCSGHLWSEYLRATV
jgi:hypothetical protein